MLELLLAVEYVPLPNFGFSPKKIFTVWSQVLRIVTDTLLGPLTLSLAAASLGADVSVAEGALGAAPVAPVVPAGVPGWFIMAP
jgi:hypothetical protein